MCMCVCVCVCRICYEIQWYEKKNTIDMFLCKESFNKSFP